MNHGRRISYLNTTVPGFVVYFERHLKKEKKRKKNQSQKKKAATTTTTTRRLLHLRTTLLLYLLSYFSAGVAVYLYVHFFFLHLPINMYFVPSCSRCTSVTFKSFPFSLSSACPFRTLVLILDETFFSPLRSCERKIEIIFVYDNFRTIHDTVVAEANVFPS